MRRYGSMSTCRARATLPSPLTPNGSRHTSTAPQPGTSALFEWFIKPVVGRTTYADQAEAGAEIVMRTSLRWRIARPSRLVDAAATGRYRVEPGYVVPG